MRYIRISVGIVLTWIVALTGVAAQQVTDDVVPEGAGKSTAAHGVEGLPGTLEAQITKKPVKADEWMVVAANPLAVKAGADVLREGGTAADAMVVVQAVLGLVEPQSSGLGGGAFLIWFDGHSGEMTTLDGRETAPLAATPTLFQDRAGDPLSFYDAAVGGRSVGVPGTPALMQAAHDKWGSADWSGLFGAAVDLAQNGFTVTPRLADLVEGDEPRLRRFAQTRSYFFPDDQRIEAGDVLRNPAYADTLRLMAEHGAKVFYNGDIAQDIVQTVQNAPGNPGRLNAVDMTIYGVKERPAVCAPYRDYDICGMGPPSSGALTVGQILGLLSGFDLSAMGPDNPHSWRLIGDASRLAFADRGRYMADSDFVPVPVKGLLKSSYLSDRAEQLNRETALSEALPGKPDYDHALIWADDDAVELPSTTHISIVDRYGNALSMTSTIENAFGSRLMTGGFLLNNELTDFAFSSHIDGVPIANRVEPGKRPRSSMAPTIVMRDGHPVLVIGSPGGSRIIGYVAKTIIAVLDWNMDVQEAVSLPHLINRWGTYDVEAETDATQLKVPLEAMGFEVEVRDLTSGLHIIAIGDELQGGADPRREGVAYGE